MNSVDVLTVMDDARRAIDLDIQYGEHSLDYYQLAGRLPEARAAVLALIEAVDAVYGDSDHPLCCGDCPTCRIRTALSAVRP